MTLREIEETLRTLEDRHPGLNEVMLTTLLKAGGWEEKNIEEAREVFRSSSIAAKRNEPEPLPPLQENPVFEPEADVYHLLESKQEEVSAAEGETTKEKESLVEENSVQLEVRENLPHNLPLRPFETSEHIWPFSRYRDVFYGDESSLEVKEERREEKPADPVSAATQSLQEEAKPPIIPQPVIAPPAPVVSTPNIHVERVPLEKDDDKLVFMASLMLVFILLILGYMYANGRL